MTKDPRVDNRSAEHVMARVGEAIQIERSWLILKRPTSLVPILREAVIWAGTVSID
jgi:hypothetical protein